MNINIQEVQLNPRKINKETHGETHYDQTQRPKKKRILKTAREKPVTTYKVYSV